MITIYNFTIDSTEQLLKLLILHAIAQNWPVSFSKNNKENASKNANVVLKYLGIRFIVRIKITII